VIVSSSALAEMEEGDKTHQDERVLGPPLASLLRAGLITTKSSSARREAQSVFGFARKLTREQLWELFADPWCVQSIIQCLSSPARQ